MSDTSPRPLDTQVRALVAAEIRAALKAGDRPALFALRSLAAAVDNAGSVPLDESLPPPASSMHVAVSAAGGPGEVLRRPLGAGALEAIIGEEIEGRRRAQEALRALGRAVEADRLEAERAALAPAAARLLAVVRARQDGEAGTG